MDLSWEVLRSHRKAVSTNTKTWNSTKLRQGRSNSIKWPQVWFWYYSDLRLYSDLRKKSFSLQFNSCMTWPSPTPFHKSFRAFEWDSTWSFFIFLKTPFFHSQLMPQRTITLYWENTRLVESMFSIVTSCHTCLSSIAWNGEQVTCHAVRKGRPIQLRMGKMLIAYI